MAYGPEELNRLHCELTSGSFSFLSYREFNVRDTKSRVIHAPAFRDRVVHHAIVRVVGPVLEMGADFHSYACRRGKGHHAALKQASSWTRRKSWYGKIDVRKYYDSVHHDTLRRLLHKRFRELRLLHLLDALIDSYSVDPGRGLPIGALTSQYLGNFYLDEFDRRMKATQLVPRYIRYMDDVALWGNAHDLKAIRGFAIDFLAELKLEAKNGGEWNRCEKGLPFLGFVLYPDRIRTNKNGRKRLRTKLRQTMGLYRRGNITELALQERITSLFAHVKHADDVPWRRTLISLTRGVDG